VARTLPSPVDFSCSAFPLLSKSLEYARLSAGPFTACPRARVVQGFVLPPLLCAHGISVIRTQPWSTVPDKETFQTPPCCRGPVLSLSGKESVALTRSISLHAKKNPILLYLASKRHNKPQTKNHVAPRYWSFSSFTGLGGFAHKGGVGRGQAHDAAQWCASVSRACVVRYRMMMQV